MGELVIATRKGKVLVVDEASIPLTGRGTADMTKLIDLEDGDAVAAVASVPQLPPAYREADE